MKRPKYKNKMLQPKLSDKMMNRAVELDRSRIVLEPESKMVAVLEQMRDEALKFRGKK